MHLLAENLRLDPGIPPWMAFAMLVVWLALVVAAVSLWRYRRASRRAAAASSAAAGSRARPAPPPEDRQLGPGTDLERW